MKIYAVDGVQGSLSTLFAPLNPKPQAGEYVIYSCRCRPKRAISDPDDLLLVRLENNRAMLFKLATNSPVQAFAMRRGQWRRIVADHQSYLQGGLWLEVVRRRVRKFLRSGSYPTS